MFKRLKETFSALMERLTTRMLSEEEILEVLDEFKISLVESDVALDVAEMIAQEVMEALQGVRVRRGVDIRSVVASTLRDTVLKLLEEGHVEGFEEELLRKAKSKKPVVLVFLGVNGVGKTTVIAKLAYRLMRLGLYPVLAASDTFRAGAQEQLEYHAKRLGVPMVKHKYGSDPAAVAYDAVMYCKARGFDAVLIDTAGRMHVDVDLMGELRKIVRVVKPDYKVLVVDALTGHDAIEQALTFDREVGVDVIVLTKVDADVKGGVALSLAATVAKPIVYVGTGQSYEDLEPFNPSYMLARLGLKV